MSLIEIANISCNVLIALSTIPNFVTPGVPMLIIFELFFSQYSITFLNLNSSPASALNVKS